MKQKNLVFSSFLLLLSIIVIPGHVSAIINSYPDTELSEEQMILRNDTDAYGMEVGAITFDNGLLYDFDAKQSNCTPDVKASGQDGPITVTEGTPVTITASLTAGDQKFKLADWWVLYYGPSGWNSCTKEGWGTGFTPMMTFPLLNIPSVQIFNSVLPVGDYTFYLMVDTVPNGLYTADEPSYSDTVQVIVKKDDPEPILPKPGGWMGSVVSFVVSTDSTKIAVAGNTGIYVDGYGPYSFVLSLKNLNCGYSITYMTSATIPITNNSFSRTYSSSDGKSSYSVTGNFDTPTSASGTYVFNTVISSSVTCSGSGKWNTNWTN